MNDGQTHGIRVVRGLGHARLLRVGTSKHLVHFRFRLGLHSRFGLWVLAGSMAFRSRRSDLVGGGLSEMVGGGREGKVQGFKGKKTQDEEGTIKRLKVGLSLLGPTPGVLAVCSSRECPSSRPY